MGETDRKDKDKMEGGEKRRKLDKEEEDVDKDEGDDEREMARRIETAVRSALGRVRDEGMEMYRGEEESGEEEMDEEQEEKGNKGWPDPENKLKNRDFVLTRIGFATDSANLIEQATTKSKRLSKAEKVTITGHSDALRRYCKEIGKVFKLRTEALEESVRGWEEWWNERKGRENKRWKELEEWERKGKQWEAERSEWVRKEKEWDKERKLWEAKEGVWKIDRKGWDMDIKQWTKEREQWIKEREEAANTTAELAARKRIEWEIKEGKWELERHKWRADRMTWESKEKRWGQESEEWNMERRGLIREREKAANSMTALAARRNNSTDRAESPFPEVRPDLRDRATSPMRDAVQRRRSAVAAGAPPTGEGPSVPAGPVAGSWLGRGGWGGRKERQGPKMGGKGDAGLGAPDGAQGAPVPPATAVVAVRVEGGLSYAEAIRRVREVPLQRMGVRPAFVRRAANGGLLLGLAGPDREGRDRGADYLADKVRAALPGASGSPRGGGRDGARTVGGAGPLKAVQSLVDWGVNRGLESSVPVRNSREPVA
ncbi:golgin subfamily A member 6-like protein 6 [Odontomachus brunneus]|uniref:golgin subfamily A member 6-like protein 6 n=1 Tax=Odontomachus brunneus TaxID=486640 RepID=UPI0013F253E4|nr:golgin subfamily A member 6-like protein 6 [Odontomachus brunneus]